MHSRTALLTVLWTAFLILAAGAAGPAYADGSVSYQCSYGDLQRRVQIHTEPGVSVPCEVHYYKDSEAPGEQQVLWSATSDATYCERKTAEFIGKLLSWGWNCGQSGDSAGGTEPATEAEPEAEQLPQDTAEEPPFIEDANQGDRH